MSALSSLSPRPSPVIRDLAAGSRVIWHRLEQFIVFVLHFEAGVNRHEDESLDGLFARARRTGFANDPDDSGGATLCGVTLKTYSAWCAANGLARPDVNDLRYMQFSRWLDVLVSLFWNKVHADDIPSDGVAWLCADWLWASGPRIIRMIQAAVKVRTDGIIGPKTLKAIRSADQRMLFDCLMDRRKLDVERIITKNPKNRKYRNGWLRRINAITFDMLLSDA